VRRLAPAIVGAAALAGCGGDPGGGGRCEERTQVAALTAAERKVVGEASPYVADPMLRGRAEALETSQRARRDAAWAVVARAVDAVPLAVDLPAHDGPETLPRWHTWYAKDDLHRIFQRVWRSLPGELRRARGAIPDDALDDGFAWNPRAVEELDNWPEERWADYVASLDDALDVDGVGGIARVGYSPSAARHLLASYAQELACLDGGAPGPFVDGPPTAPQVAREPIALGACQEQRLGPYFVAGGETLTAHAEVDGAVALEVVDATGAVLCTSDGAPCTAEGSGARYVVVASELDAVQGELRVEHAAPDAPWAACVDGRFPGDAAVVKANWERAELGFQVAVHDTSADTLRARRAGDFDWGDGEATADPGPDAIYTVRAGSGNVYRLTALHLMTRELDHWLWVTLWWSPEPDGDFGADRPPSITGIWSHYKMCTTVAFDERDPDPEGGYRADHPDLAAALAATWDGVGAPSWCSNPYLERGIGNADSNCVGCHQHGGTKLPPELILEGDAHGRGLARNNFPADYTWSTDRGDELATMLRTEVLYWDAVE